MVQRKGHVKTKCGKNTLRML